MTIDVHLNRRWWLKHRYFLAYMLREATVLPLSFFLLCLISALWTLQAGDSAWQHWLDFMGRPAVLAMNALALFASLWHAWTFFQLFPRVMPLRLGGRQVPDRLIVMMQWLMVGLATLFFLVLFAWSSS